MGEEHTINIGLDGDRYCLALPELQGVLQNVRKIKVTEEELVYLFSSSCTDVVGKLKELYNKSEK